MGDDNFMRIDRAKQGMGAVVPCTPVHGVR